MTLGEIAAVTGGTLHGADVTVDGPVVTDSRQASRGGLYVARIGEHADGHIYAPAAAENGAVGTLGLRPIDGVPTVVVGDVQQAFAALARSQIDRCPGLQIVGITGSSGKTSTKDMLGQVLASAGETVAPEGSLNSEVGVPLTVCRVRRSTRFLIAEMGASGVGHIGYLTSIAPPRIGIVLNVGSAHIGEFGSVEAIAATKSELVQALPAAGLAVLNADDPLVSAMADRTAASVVTVGTGAGADLRATDIDIDAAGRASFTVSTPEGTIRVRLGFHGAHQVGNALAVLAAVRELGMALPDAVRALGSARPLSRWRMEVFALPTGVTLVNDAYNANPESTAVALRTLAMIGGGRRTVAVLGEMRELGELAEQAHRDIGALAADLGIDHLVVVGPGAFGIAAGAIAAAATSGGAGGHVQVDQVLDVDAAHDLLADGLREGDVVLFKSSRDSGLRYLGDRLARESGARVP